MSNLHHHAREWIEHLRGVHDDVRHTVTASRGGTDDLARPVGQGAGDVVYRLDAHVEPVILEHAKAWARDWPLVLIAEGIGANGITVLPESATESDAVVRVIVDPIDGTRGLMYDKRSAWCLTAVAPNRGRDTSLRDIAVAMMSELPTRKQNQYDEAYAIRGQGAEARRRALDGASESLALRPSMAETLDHGFAAVSSFFPGTKRAAADLMEAIAAAFAIGDDGDDIQIFDDQYVSTGGQLYELMAGHDRFLCDMRARFYSLAGRRAGHCCHPYDICTMLIAEELGVIITDGHGRPLDAPLDVHTNLDWAGYANRDLQARIEPIVLDWFSRHDKGGVS